MELIIWKDKNIFEEEIFDYVQGKPCQKMIDLTERGILELEVNRISRKRFDDFVSDINSKLILASADNKVKSETLGASGGCTSNSCERCGSFIEPWSSMSMCRKCIEELKFDFREELRIDSEVILRIKQDKVESKSLSEVF